MLICLPASLFKFFSRFIHEGQNVRDPVGNFLNWVTLILCICILIMLELELFMSHNWLACRENFNRLIISLFNLPESTRWCVPKASFSTTLWLAMTLVLVKSLKVDRSHGQQTMSMLFEVVTFTYALYVLNLI